MPGRLVIFFLLAAVAAGCARKVETPQGALYLRGCDDGGDGVRVSSHERPSQLRWLARALKIYFFKYT